MHVTQIIMTLRLLKAYFNSETAKNARGIKKGRVEGITYRARNTNREKGSFKK